jgi:hypothetical protein
MNYLLARGILLAQRGRVDSLSSGFRGRRFETRDIVICLSVVAGVAVAVGLLSYLLRIQERRRGRPSPLRLFLSLCKAHRLRWSQRWLLWRVARAQRLRDPARLFLEPRRLLPAGLGLRFEGRWAQLEEIYDRLFDQLDQAAEPVERETSDRQADVAPTASMAAETVIGVGASAEDVR